MKYPLFALFSLSQVFISVAQPLFTEVLSADSKITFENSIVDTDTANIFLYSAFYSGSGVAIGDINGDNLPDIYFGGNQKPDALYLNKGNLKFEEITVSAGIMNKGGWSAGVNMVDINQDGLMDIYVSKTLYDEYPELRKNELYINNGDLTFTESAYEYGLADIWRSQHASFFDFDKDGDLDVFLVNQPPNPGYLSSLKPFDWRSPMLAGKMMMNDNGYFRDITQQAGLYDKGYPLTAMVTDYNNDNWPDIYVTNDYNSPDKLYINQRDGTFKNSIDDSMGHISYFSMGCDAADINNDGLNDIIVVDMVAADNYRVKANMSGMNPKAFWNTVNSGGHYQYMLNTLQVNGGQNSKGTTKFSEISQLANVAYTDWSWSPLLADFDNDGNKDLIITNGLLKDIRNNDANKEAQAYLKPYKKIIDDYVANPQSINIWEHISLDTLLSFYPSVPLSNYAFSNNGKFVFTDVTATWGLDYKGFTVGSAYADLDLDGDLDIVFNNINQKASIFKNNSIETSTNKSLIVEVKTPKGLSLYGTKLKVETDEKTLYCEIENARGFYSTSDIVQIIGLGAKPNLKSLEIFWTNGLVSKIGLRQKEGRILVDYLLVDKINIKPKKTKTKIFNINDSLNSIGHSENIYNDYAKEVLLPHTMSDIGPKVAYSKKHKLLFIPGSKGNKGIVYSLTGDGKKSIFQTLADPEEVAGLFVDLNNDGFEDLVVVPGGNENSLSNDVYKTRIYLNRNNDFHLLEPGFENVSGQLILSSDYDGDGDMDLFIGGRQLPGKYPRPASSNIYKNLLVEQGVLKFENATNLIYPQLKDIGLVTDGIWQDIDGDKDIDLVLVGEWMKIIVLENVNGTLIDNSIALGLDNTAGWWNTIEMNDFDKDGDLDFVVGNLGLNYKFKATEEEPFKVYYSDYDVNGSNDIVLSYYNDGEEYPVRGRECSSQQVPSIKSNFRDYNSFASSSLNDIYGIEKLKTSYQLESVKFESVILENDSNKGYSVLNLPIEAQFSAINGFQLLDIDKNGYLDIIYGGNKYGSEIETPRADASFGGVLLNWGGMKYTPLTSKESGLYLKGEIKWLEIIKIYNKDVLLVFPNNGNVMYFTIH